MPRTKTRTISLKGAAAKGFMEALMGVQPQTETQELEQLASVICALVKAGDMDKAVLTLKDFREKAFKKASAPNLSAEG